MAVEVGDGDFVCHLCGVVDGHGSTVSASFGEELPAPRAGYKRSHHLSGRLNSLVCQDSRVPDDVLELVEAELRTGRYGVLCRAGRPEVYRALAAARVPPWMQEKYRSRKFKRYAMRDLRRYYKNWRQILQRATRQRLAMPAPELLDRVRHGFQALQPFFEDIRHSRACDALCLRTGNRPRDCHRQPATRCRYSFPAYNFVILQLVERYGGLNERRRWEHCFPPITREKTRRIQALWDLMEEAVGWRRQRGDAAQMRAVRAVGVDRLPAGSLRELSGPRRSRLSYPVLRARARAALFRLHARRA